MVNVRIKGRATGGAGPVLAGFGSPEPPAEARSAWTNGWLAPALLLLCLMAGTAGMLTLRSSGPPASTPVAHTASGWSAVPLSARGVVSAALGADRAQFSARPGGGGFVAANRAQHLRFAFTPAGLLVDSAGTWLGLRLARVGFEGHLVPVASVRPTAERNRVRYARPGIVESYANGPLGLEQDFTIAHPSHTGIGPLILAMTESGDLRAALTRTGVVLSRQGRPVLAYRDLVVKDAHGRRLPARITVGPAQLQIRIDAAGAAYPLHVDPYVQTADLTASDGTVQGYLGQSVAVSANGSTVVAGAPGYNGNAGAAYVFASSNGSWGQVAKLNSAGETASDEFGISVAVSGDGSTVVVGAASYGQSPLYGQGAAYVFTDVSGGWSQAAQLTAADPGMNENFGQSVAISAAGTTIAATEPGATVNTSQLPTGAAYIFTGSGANWSQTEKLTASDGVAGAVFGSAIAISSDGSTIAVGDADFGTTSSTPVGTGAVYAFSGANGTYSQTAELAGPTGAQLGGTVGVSGNGSTIVAEANGQMAEYVFAGTPGSWAQTAKLDCTSSTGKSLSLGAVTISADGSTIAAGAPGNVTGQVCLWVGSGGSWTQTAVLSGSDSVEAQQGQHLGSAVALSSDASTVVGGANDKTVGGNDAQGAAYVFHGSSAALSIAAASTVEPKGSDGTLSFPVTLNQAQNVPVTVTYATSDGTAIAGSDYATATGTLTMPAGVTTATIPVTVHDVGVEGNKALTMTLSNPSEGVSLGRATATGTILGRGPLQVGVAWLQNGNPIVLHRSGQADAPNTLQLADADDGEVPQDVTAEVTITNTSASVTQTNVSVNGIPALSYHAAANALQQLPIVVTAGPGIAGSSTSLPDLAPGQSTKIDYTLHVTNNGVFDFSPQILSSDQTLTDTEISNGAGTLTVLPTALLWVTLKTDTSTPLAPGGKLYVSGTVTNRSLTQSLDFYGLEPADDGNLGGGALADITDPTLPDGISVPFSGVLKPGQSADVGGVLTAAPAADTTGTATYDPLGALVNSDGSETELTASQIGMSADSSPISVKIGEAPPALGVDDDTVMGAFTGSAATGMGLWALNGFQAAEDLIRHPIDTAYGIGSGIVSFAVASTKLASSAAYLVASVYGYTVGFADLSSTERQRVEAQIVEDYQSTQVGKLVDLGTAQVQKIINDIQAAGDSGNYVALAKLFGTGAANTLTGVADYVLADITFQKLAQGMKIAARGASGTVASSDGYLVNGIRLQTALDDAKVAQVLGKGVAGLKAGMNLLLDNAKFLTEDFGLTTKQITELQNYCERSNLIIAVRQRSAKAAQLIKNGLAVAKNEIIKIKAVNSVDEQFLGYSRHDLNTVVWAEPVSKQYVEAQLAKANASAEVREVVLQRYDIRVKEWKDPSIRSVLNNSDISGTIDWGFNGDGNGAPGANKQADRRFELRNQGSPVPGEGRTYQQVLVGNKPGVAKNIRLVPITQDVDVMAILRANGEILSPEERAAAYIHLMDVIDMQHGETPSWIMNGEIVFQKKAKQLVDVIPGGEPLAVFSPKGGVTAGFFDPALTVFDNSTLGGRIFFKGGYNDPYSLLAAKVSLSAKTLGDAL